MKTVYAYDPITNEYIGTDEAPRNPKNPATYLIPAFATENEPPAPGENQKVVWDGQAWQLENIPEPEPEPEPIIEDPRAILQSEISNLQMSYLRLLTTDATEAELTECKEEILNKLEEYRCVVQYAEEK
jgi:hypothetical protein